MKRGKLLFIYLTEMVCYDKKATSEVEVETVKRRDGVIENDLRE